MWICPSMRRMKRNKAQQRLQAYVLLLSAGFLYLAAGEFLGISLPCPFHFVTGLDCPGCGVTRMATALFHGDFRAAWQANPAILLALPVLAWMLLREEWDFWRGRPKRPEPVWLIWGLLVYFCIFGIGRNL